MFCVLVIEWFSTVSARRSVLGLAGVVGLTLAIATGGQAEAVSATPPIPTPAELGATLPLATVSNALGFAMKSCQPRRTLALQCQKHSCARESDPLTRPGPQQLVQAAVSCFWVPENKSLMPATFFAQNLAGPFASLALGWARWDPATQKGFIWCRAVGGAIPTTVPPADQQFAPPGGCVDDSVVQKRGLHPPPAGFVRCLTVRGYLNKAANSVTELDVTSCMPRASARALGMLWRDAASRL